MKRAPIVLLLGLAIIYSAIALATDLLPFEWWVPVVIIGMGAGIQALKWHFQRQADYASRAYLHPELGELLTNGYGMWGPKGPVEGLVQGNGVGVVLYGDRNGPSEGALTHFAEFVDSPSQHWERLLAAVDSERAEYQDAWAERLATVSRPYPSETVFEVLWFVDESTVGVSGQFGWQHPNDDHSVTVYSGPGNKTWATFDG